ncbi:carbohydrate ABC transporter substrate-binding protein (CUT1 family) [Hydrogenispora ethanolica]|uniref:Carbohydrate ABC transporter substrate-binding protein (CUT1 family) n=2 Tax=Hydrogenispora ethanolica TaxID=1082276 RepID=A0A4V2QC40_HYDET|nr:carbohydrate ABC transporter substrate-binding protein (CUT1 family) [Hydrogenispora ethanolica]
MKGTVEMKKAYRRLFLAIFCTFIFSIAINFHGQQSFAAGAKNVTITYWTHDEPTFLAANKELIARFEKQYPNIKVKHQYFPYDVLEAKEKAAYATKNESDVQQIFGSWAIEFTKHGLFDAVPKSMADEAKRKYFQAPLGGYTFQGKLYGIPREFNLENGGVLYYPNEIAAAGWEKFPETYQDLVGLAQKLTKYDSKGNITHYGFDFSSTDNVPYLFLSLILQQGGNYWKPDNVHVTFTTPEAEKAMQAMADLILKYKVCDMKHSNDPNVDISDYFFKGTSGMCFRGPWVIANGVNTYKLKNFRYAPMPSFTGKSLAFAAESGWGEVVSARSKNKKAAWTFIKFITSQKNNLLFNSKTYTIPADKSVAASAEFMKANPLIKPSLDVLPYGRPIGPLQSVDRFKQEIVYAQFQKVVDKKIDIKTALKAIETQTNSMIDELLAQ